MNFSQSSTPKARTSVRLSTVHPLRRITPFSWAISNASAICRDNLRDSSTGIAPRFTRSANVAPFDQLQHEEVRTVVFFKADVVCGPGSVIDAVTTATEKQPF